MIPIWRFWFIWWICSIWCFEVFDELLDHFCFLNKDKYPVKEETKTLFWVGLVRNASQRIRFQYSLISIAESVCSNILIFWKKKHPRKEKGKTPVWYGIAIFFGQ